MSYEAVIGLEVHAQLLTESKIFCSCSTEFGAPPNTNTCPVCLGFPGALPVLNREAAVMAVKAALALQCKINPVSIFARKNYFYPDLPKGYQISQFDRPLAEHGYTTLPGNNTPKEIRIKRVHLEEDAGKSIHDGFADSDRHSYIDLNRSGTPLIEIVSEPDIHSPEEAHEYLNRLKVILEYLEVCDGNMEEGSLRCDANISVRPVGEQKLGIKTELKNLNSFRFLKNALEYEIARQIQILEQGGNIVQETRLSGTLPSIGQSPCGARKRPTTTAIFRSPIFRHWSSMRHGRMRSAHRCRSSPKPEGTASSSTMDFPNTMRVF